MFAKRLFFGLIASVALLCGGVPASAQSLTNYFSLPITNWGPCLGTNDTATFTKAMAAATASSAPGTLWVPNGCTIGPVTIAAGVTLQGIGPGLATVNALAPNQTTFTMSLPSEAIRGLTINQGYAGTSTSGTAILVNSNAKGSQVSNVIINGTCNGIDLSGALNAVRDTQIYYGGSGCYAVELGRQTTSGNTIDTLIDGVAIASSQSSLGQAGFLIVDAGGLFIDHSSVTYGQSGTLMEPGANQVVQWATISNTYLGDTVTGTPFAINPGAASAVVKGIQLTTDWTSSGSQNGVLIENTGGGTVSGIHFLGHRAYNNTFDGAYILAGSDISFDASHFCGNGATYSAISVYSGITGFAARGNRGGGPCDGFSGAQAYGIAFAGTAPGAILTGNDFSGATSGPYSGWPAQGSLIGPNVVAIGDGSTNVTTALNAYFSQSVANGVCAYLPPGRYLVSTLTTINTGSTGSFCLKGDNPFSTVIVTNSATGDVLTVLTQRGQISNIGFDYSGGGHRTSGSYINTTTNFSLIENVDFEHCYYCLTSADNVGTYDYLTFEQIAATAVTNEEFIRTSGGAGGIRIHHAMNSGFTGTLPHAGVHVFSSATNPAITISDSDFLTTTNGFLDDATSGCLCGAEFSNVHFDTGVNGINIALSGTASVARSHFSNVWTTSGSGNGVTIAFSSGTASVSGLYFTNLIASADSASGFVANATNGTIADLQIIGGGFSGNGADGIVTTGVTNLRIEGVTAGTGGGLGANTTTGISVNGGSNVIITGNTALGNSVSDIFSSATGTVVKTNNVCTSGSC